MDMLLQPEHQQVKSLSENLTEWLLSSIQVKPIQELLITLILPRLGYSDLNHCLITLPARYMIRHDEKNVTKTSGKLSIFWRIDTICSLISDASMSCPE